MSLATILTLLICVGAVIGAIVGVFKGYIRTSAWGGTVLFTLLIVRAFAPKVASGSMQSSTKGLVILGVTLGVLLVIMLLFGLTKFYLKRAMEKHKELSYYKKYDEREENTERILTAIDEGDRKAYRKNVKHKYKASAGAWGITNRVAGAIFAAVNVAVAIAIVFSFVIVTVDFARVDSLNKLFSDVLNNATWQGTGAKWAFDLAIIALMSMCIIIGYKNGLLSSLSALVVIGLLVGAMFLSYHLAVYVSAFNSLAHNIADNFTFLDSVESVTSYIGFTKIKLARVIVTVGLFIIMLVPIIIIGIFLPKLIERIRSDKVVSVADGVLGAIVYLVVIFGIIMIVSAILYTLHDIEFMDMFNAYADEGAGCNYMLGAIYQFNPLNGLSVIQNLPLHTYLAPKE